MWPLWNYFSQKNKSWDVTNIPFLFKFNCKLKEGGGEIVAKMNWSPLQHWQVGLRIVSFPASLAREPAGNPHLPRGTHGRYSLLGPTPATEWETWNLLQMQDPCLENDRHTTLIHSSTPSFIFIWYDPSFVFVTHGLWMGLICIVQKLDSLALTQRTLIHYSELSFRQTRDATGKDVNNVKDFFF